MDIFGNCVSYNISGDDSIVPVTKQTTKVIDLNEKSARYYEKGDNHSKILKRNDQNGPIVVHLDKRDWTTVQEEFREAECGGNLPIDWLLWRVYAVNIPCFYKLVLIKNRTHMRLNVIECMRNGYWCSVQNIVLFCKMFYCM